LSGGCQPFVGLKSCINAGLQVNLTAAHKGRFQCTMLKKHLLVIIIILLAFLLMVIVMWVFSKRIERIDDQIKAGFIIYAFVRLRSGK
jgi:predicted Na+-dependent transporter